MSATTSFSAECVITGLGDIVVRTWTKVTNEDAEEGFIKVVIDSCDKKLKKKFRGQLGCLISSFSQIEEL